MDPAVASNRRNSGVLRIFVDPEGERGSALFDLPPSRERTPSPGITREGGATPRVRGWHGSGAAAAFGTPRTAVIRGRILFGPPSPGRGNMPMTALLTRVPGRQAPGNSALPSQYLRTPCRDITPFTRAIERHGSSLAGTREQGSQLLQAQGLIASQPSVVPVNHEATAPSSAVRKNLQQQLAAQKLLYLIEMVKDEIMDELEKLKKTPSFKREERKKLLRILRSMR